MVSYSFKKQFGEPILTRAKRQTIRAPRVKGPSRHARPGDKLQLYTGLRTQYVRFLGEALCLRADPIALNFRSELIMIDGSIVRGSVDDFARADGFAGWRDMEAFWKQEHPEVFTENEGIFSGYIISWGETLVPHIEGKEKSQ